MTIENIVKLVIHKISLGGRKLFLQKLCPLNNLAKGAFSRKGNSMTGTTESYGTNTPCTRLAGDKWEVGNGGKRQEDSVRHL